MHVPSFDLIVLALGAMGLGMVLLMRGGDWTIEGAVFVAERAGISKMLIGFTVVAAGTSLPELLVSVNANLSGSPAIALGNVMGSNIANILLILGATAILQPVITSRRGILRDCLMMLAATALLLGLLALGDIDRLTGCAMILALVVYMIWQYRSDAGAGEALAEEVSEPRFDTVAGAVSALVLGFIGVAFGAELLVRGASTLAKLLGVSDAVIGLTIVAFGTSLPELATSIAATVKRHTDVLIGNVIGSNVFNILLIIGATAAIKPLALDAGITLADMAIFGGVSLGFALWLFALARVGRVGGVVFICCYVAFVAWQFRDIMGWTI